MKKLLLCFGFLAFSPMIKAQGLENIIVEKYYISDANDALANADGGVLPVGSVTYRIYVDMLPGYKFQAAFGIPAHEMRIETSTLFFNNEDRGATTPAYSKTQAKNNTVMLDSWLSVGAACTGNFGVLKSDDDGASTVVNSYSPMILQNNDAAAGIPLSTQDGMIAGTPEAVTTLGINTEIAVFDNQNDGTNGPLFSTFNGSWASLNGSVGPLADNKVLIAQITTDGVFSFELNIQIGTPTGDVEQYVAKDATGAEILFAGLTYNSSTATGISNPTNAYADFSAFPNPVNDVLHLNMSNFENTKSAICNVYDSKGMLVASKAVSSLQNGTIDFSDFSNGLYVVQITDGNKNISKRIIKN